MNEHPILFSGEMVRGILDGRKSQTRRVMKSQPIGVRNSHSQNIEPGDRYVNLGQVFYAYESTGRNKAASGELTYKICECPYGKVGDRLWVRETWATDFVMDDDPPRNLTDDFPVWWKADEKWRTNRHQACAISGKWRPSIFMPKWAARIWLEITGIRVERVQEIDAVEAEAEGMRRPKRLCPDRHDEYILERFIRFWNLINAKRGYGWEKNPWCWVIEFKRVQEMPDGKEVAK